jgi:uncharacterized membrane protein
MMRIIGFVLLAVGFILLLFGFNASQSVGEQVVEGVTGRFTDETMMFIIGGVAALVAGGAMAIWGGERRIST